MTSPAPSGTVTLQVPERHTPVFMQLSKISKRFGAIQALKSVDLELLAGEVHCLCGQNGCGKSTLIKIMSGVFRPQTGGTITIRDKTYDRLTALQSMAFGIQVIYQDLSLFPNLTVAENIGIGQHRGLPHSVRWSRIRATAKTAMASVGVSIDLEASVADLPIAQRQLVAICRAIAGDAKLLIMDEPTASLTRHEVDALLRYVEVLKERGLCIVFVSHRLDEVLQVADRVTVIRDGEKIGTFEAEGMNDRRLAILMTGKEFSYELRPRPDEAEQPIVLQVSNLSRAGEYADVSFSIRAGEILGLTGLLGSGRTELALSLFGMTQPDSGSIELSGHAVTLRSNRDAIRHGVAYVPEDRLSLGLALEQPISSNILASTLKRLAGSLGLIDPGRRRQEAERWIADLSIKVGDADDPVRTLSGGNQQRLVLAKWMACQPRLLILDSPTVGVDIGAKDGIYDLVRKLAEKGIAVLMISDEVPEVFYHSHRILIMRNGHLTGEYNPMLSSEGKVNEAVYA